MKSKVAGHIVPDTDKHARKSRSPQCKSAKINIPSPDKKNKQNNRILVFNNLVIKKKRRSIKHYFFTYFSRRTLKFAVIRGQICSDLRVLEPPQLYGILCLKKM